MSGKDNPDVFGVELTYEDGAWLVAVPALPDVHTFGRTQAKAVANAREAIALWLEVERDRPVDLEEVELDLRFRIDDQADELVRQAADARQAAVRSADVAQGLTRDAAVALTRAGLSTREAGDVLGLSHQRISQVLDSAPASRPQRPTQAKPKRPVRPAAKQRAS